MPPLSQFPAPNQLPEQPDENRYDFFMAPEAAQKKGLFSGSGGGMSTKKMILIALAVVLVLGILGAILFALFGKKDAPIPVVVVAQSQTEIIRIATDGGKNIRSTGNLKNFAISAQVALTSSQQQLLAAADKQGIKINPKQLDAGKNAQTDRALAASLSANTYDGTFKEVMKTEIDKYLSEIDTAFAITPAKTPLSLELKKERDGATLLRQQLLE